MKAALNRAEIVAEAVNLARDLVNTPPSDLHPADLAAARHGCRHRAPASRSRSWTRRR